MPFEGWLPYRNLCTRTLGDQSSPVEMSLGNLLKYTQALALGIRNIKHFMAFSDNNQPSTCTRSNSKLGIQP